REFDKEAAQFFASGASDHCLWQGASEDQKNAAKPTSSKTDSSGCFGIEGILVNTPRETIARAFQLNWIKNEKLWLSMLEDRNLTSHIYSETEANQIFDRIHDLYVGELKNLFQLLKKRRDSSYDGSK
ncbi:MAG TPA: HI0074 family nucleotidyltransferase substrate-binding subunit, partial [Rhabdochlamydiaceae bacterium]|nr:HI0074 family nucleotidyltransferase substrate-binding subunit [Rhabdochlamydiaceae bacterium]HSX38938.1 HI0074 family nucleotidyltransferase substrate-binding subunit [Chlamydiales bacterium]